MKRVVKLRLLFQESVKKRYWQESRPKEMKFCGAALKFRRRVVTSAGRGSGRRVAGQSQFNFKAIFFVSRVRVRNDLHGD